jgi:hypothetical protein
VQHVPIAKMTGVSDEQVAALARDDAAAACFDPSTIVLRATDDRPRRPPTRLADLRRISRTAGRRLCSRSASTW